MKICKETIIEEFKKAGLEITRIKKSKIGGWHVYHPYGNEHSYTNLKFIKNLHGASKLFERETSYTSRTLIFDYDEEDFMNSLHIGIHEAKLKKEKI